MTLTAGVVTLVSLGATTVSLSATAATGGTGAVTYQWYRSTTTGFTPGGGNIISGATALTLNDSGLIPNTPYFYKLQATDTTPTTVTYTQFAATTNGSVLSPNQFSQSVIAGMVDQLYAANTMSCQVDLSQSGSLFAGSAVKMVNNTGGVPKVVGCAADSDNVLGFINFDIKDAQYIAGSAVEISRGGNVIYLYATGAIARQAQVTLDLTSPASVAQIVSSSGNNIVGWAFDAATAYGQLIRVALTTPSFASA